MNNKMHKHIFWEKLGERIKAFRVLKNMSQQEFAESMKICRTGVMKLEVGLRKLSVYEANKLRQLGFRGSFFDLPE